MCKTDKSVILVDYMNKLFKNNDSKIDSDLIATWNFTSKNYWMFLTGLIFIIVGYILMINGEVYSFQSLTLAPILLFLGYIIIIPAALIFQDKKSWITNGIVVQLVRTPACQAGGREFKSRRSRTESRYHLPLNKSLA